MSVNCTLFGLGIRVNRTLSGLVGLPRARDIDVDIRFGTIPLDSINPRASEVEEFYSSPRMDAYGKPTLLAARLRSSGAIRISYCDGTIFVISENAKLVWATTPPGQTVEDTAAYLLGPIIGLVLRLRGITCLHGSAVVIGGQAVGLVGVSGAGKSTTAAAFARLGYPVMTDDVLALSDCGNHFLVRPAYPRVRMWPESVVGLFGSADVLPLMTPNWDKRFLGLDAPGYCFQSKPLPLAGVYFLGPRTVGLDPLVVESVRPAKALMALVSDSYAANYVYESLRAKEFEILSRLVKSVPLRSVSARDDFSYIDEFCDVIVRDFRTQRSAAVAAPL